MREPTNLLFAKKPDVGQVKITTLTELVGYAMRGEENFELTITRISEGRVARISLHYDGLDLYDFSDFWSFKKSLWALENYRVMDCVSPCEVELKRIHTNACCNELTYGSRRSFTAFNGQTVRIEDSKTFSIGNARNLSKTDVLAILFFGTHDLFKINRPIKTRLVTAWRINTILLITAEEMLTEAGIDLLTIITPDGSSDIVTLQTVKDESGTINGLNFNDTLFEIKPDGRASLIGFIHDVTEQIVRKHSVNSLRRESECTAQTTKESC